MTNRSRLINFLRWTSALLVVLGHIRSILFADFTEINNASFFLKTFYLITSLGHEAVMVFFVISGYLVGGGIINKIKKSNFNINIYLFYRITRLYLVLPAALIITFLFDKLGILLDSSIYENGRSISSLQYDVMDRLSLVHFFGSLFMLQNIYTHSFGSNGPLWSLSYEFWYYILAGLGGLCFLLLKTKKILIGSVLALVLLLTAVWLPLVYLKYFIIWMMGTCIYFVKPKMPSKAVPFLLIIVLTAFIAVYKTSLLIYISSFDKDLITAFLISLIICFIPDGKKAPQDIHHHLASFSYTLYLVHYPFMLCILAGWNSFTGFGIKELPQVSTFLSMGVLVIITLYFSYFISLFTEAKTDVFRNKALQAFMKVRQLKLYPRKA